MLLSGIFYNLLYFDSLLCDGAHSQREYFKLNLGRSEIRDWIELIYEVSSGTRMALCIEKKIL